MRARNLVTADNAARASQRTLSWRRTTARPDGGYAERARESGAGPLRDCPTSAALVERRDVIYKCAESYMGRSAAALRQIRTILAALAVWSA